MDPTGIDYVLQFGGLGIAAYLIFWITRKLNGKLDRLARAVERLTDIIEERGHRI